MKKAIILAAGMGNRISNNINEIPKAFLRINGKKIIDHQINAIRENGIKEIVIVTGYKAELFEQHFLNERDIKLIINPFYKHCNVLGSLWFARDYMDDGFIFLHADTLFDKRILTLVIDHPAIISLAVEYKKSTKEEMKVKVKDNCIIEINKTMKCVDAHGEFTGIAKIDKKAGPIIKKLVNDCIEKENLSDAFFEVVFQKIIDSKAYEIFGVDIMDYKSIEIDFIEDYEAAKKLFPE